MFDIQKHKEAIKDNRKAFDATGAVRYDKLEMTKVLGILLVKVLAEFDPQNRKSWQESEKLIGDPSKPVNGFTEETIPVHTASGIFRPGIKLLDFACGTGLVTEKLVRYAEGSEITGIDVSEHALERFTEKMSKFDTVKTRALNLDILDLTPEQDLELQNSFDVIVCTIAYHHFSNYVEITKKLSTFLTKGGWLLIVDFYNEDVETTTDFSKANSATKHMGGLKLSSLNESLSGAGLEQVSAARELRTSIWQYKPFVESHCTQKVIDEFHKGILPTMKAYDGEDVFLVEASLVLAAGRKP